jgi:hypothetical protein
MRWRYNLKGLSLERRWTKSAENLTPLSLRETYRLIPLSAKQISLDSPFECLKLEAQMSLLVTLERVPEDQQAGDLTLEPPWWT